jgi:hypothetical protein
MAAFATAEEWVLHDHTDSNARSPPPTSSLMSSRRVITSVVWLLEIMKDSSWGLLRHFSSNHRTTCWGSLGGKKSESKNHQIQLFQKSQRTGGFHEIHERTGKHPKVIRWLVDSFNFLRTMVIYQNCFFVLKNLWYEP